MKANERKGPSPRKGLRAAASGPLGSATGDRGGPGSQACDGEPCGDRTAGQGQETEHGKCEEARNSRS